MAKRKFITVHNHLFFPDRKRVRRSRLVMAEFLGRSLLRTEHIHHKNEDTMDDSIQNLELMDWKQHSSFHRKGKSSSNGFKGKYHTIETRKRMSLVHKGKYFTVEHRKKISVSRKNCYLRQIFPGL